MRFVCLAYGAQDDWLALTDDERAALLAQDDVLRSRGALISVLGEPTVVTNHSGTPVRAATPYASSAAPLVGVSLLEAADLDEAVALVAGTPCAVAGGAIEVRPVVDLPTG